MTMCHLEKKLFRLSQRVRVPLNAGQDIERRVPRMPPLGKFVPNSNFSACHSPLFKCTKFHSTKRIRRSQGTPQAFIVVQDFSDVGHVMRLPNYQNLPKTSKVVGT